MDTKAAGALTAQRRKQLSLSQAERLHMTYKAVSRRETGRGMPGQSGAPLRGPGPAGRRAAERDWIWW